jgi:hypothetical protein
MGDMRPKIQYLQLPLAFMTEGRGETPDAGREGTESPMAKRGPENAATGESLMEGWRRCANERTSKRRGIESAPTEGAPASMAGPSTRPGTTSVSTGQPSGNGCSTGLTGRNQ